MLSVNVESCDVSESCSVRLWYSVLRRQLKLPSLELQRSVRTWDILACWVLRHALLQVLLLPPFGRRRFATTVIWSSVISWKFCNSITRLIGAMENNLPNQWLIIKYYDICVLQLPYFIIYRQGSQFVQCLYTMRY